MQPAIVGDARFIARFEALVMPEPMTGCWLWMGAPGDSTKNGQYGRFRLRGRQHAAHRVSWMLYCGPIPEGIEVLHHCDVQPCVNPSHLFLGTNADNVADRVKKGRSGNEPHPGERHPMARLHEPDVRRIRMRYAHGETGRALAKEFGIAPATLSNIVTRKRWRHLS
jgi:HNH endonuclease